MLYNVHSTVSYSLVAGILPSFVLTLKFAFILPLKIAYNVTSSSTTKESIPSFASGFKAHPMNSYPSLYATAVSLALPLNDTLYVLISDAVPPFV